MTKKTPRIGDKKKVSGIKEADDAAPVDSTKAVTGAQGVKRVSGVGGVDAAGGVRKRQSTRVMSMQEREALFAMINEEAEKMIEEGLLPKGRKAVVADAVRMAVDSAIVDEDEEPKGK